MNENKQPLENGQENILNSNTTLQTSDLIDGFDPFVSSSSMMEQKNMDNPNWNQLNTLDTVSNIDTIPLSSVLEESNTEAAPISNLMEDFSNVVVEPKLESDANQSVPSSIEDDSMPSENIVLAEQNQMMPNTVASTTEINAPSNIALNSIENDSVAPAQVGQVSKEAVPVPKKSRNPWIFILAVSAVIAIFILLLRVLVDTFGY